MRKIATFGLPIAAALAIAGCASVGNSEGQSDEREKAKLGNPSSPAIERVALEGPEGLRDFVYPAFKGQPVLARHYVKSPDSVLTGQNPACAYPRSAAGCYPPEAVGLHAMMSLWHAATVPASEVPLSNAALFLSEKRFKEWGLAVEEERGLTAPDNPPWPNQRYDAGDNNFEKRDLRQRFEDELAPELKKWGKSLPNRVWLVWRVIVREYDFEKGAFQLAAYPPQSPQDPDPDQIGAIEHNPLDLENGGFVANNLTHKSVYERARPSSQKYLDPFFVHRWWLVPEASASGLWRTLESHDRETKQVYLAVDATVRRHAFAEAQGWHDVPQDKYGQPLDPVVEVHRHVLYRDKGLTKRVEPNWDATRVEP